MNPIKQCLIGITLDAYIKSEEPLPPHLRETTKPGLYEIFASAIKQFLFPEKKEYPQHNYTDSTNTYFSREYGERKEAERIGKMLEKICS